MTTTAAVFLEPIQGEAGVRPRRPATSAAAREATSAAGALLILDEVQTGIGRTGKWLASEATGIVPDAVTLAKGLGGGFPVGASSLSAGNVCAADRRPARHHLRRQPGRQRGRPRHAGTIESQDLLANVRRLGSSCAPASAGIRWSTEVRGEGLLIGSTSTATRARRRGGRRDGGFIVNAGPDDPAGAAADPDHRAGRPFPGRAAGTARDRQDQRCKGRQGPPP